MEFGIDKKELTPTLLTTVGYFILGAHIVKCIIYTMYIFKIACTQKTLLF